MARRQLGLGAAASGVPLLGLLGVSFLDGTVSVPSLAIAGLCSVGVLMPLRALWRDGVRIDRLADGPARAAEPSRAPGEPIARIGAAFMALERRIDALQSLGDPARRDDPMTGLPNRQTAMRRARDEISRTRRSDEPLSVALLSLDIGPGADDPLTSGRQDRALRLMAELLMQSLRAYDVVARWSRDEFVVIMPGAEVEHAVAAIERICAMAAEGWSVRGGETLPAIHGGVAVLQPDDATLAEIVARASRALRRARDGIGAAVQAAPGPRTRPVQLRPV